jgi:hypothetical protein
MRTKMSKSLFICLALLTIPVWSSQAQNEGNTKKYHQTYTTNSNSHLFIDNKYGSIDINDWDKKQVDIDVRVLVDGVSDETAEKILSYIDVAFSQDGDDIKATTNFDDRFGKISDGNHKLEINYTVNLPKDIKLSLDNKYGGIFITELTGETYIDIKYGNLKANKLLRGNEKPLSELDLSYSEASIEEIGWMKMDLKYSNLTIEKAQAIVMYSKYSPKISINDISSLVCESKYDHFDMGRLSNFVIEAGYSDIKIKEIDKKLSSNTNYSDCTVDKIPAGFESIAVDTRYGNYRLGIDKAASYQLDGYAGYAKISYPETGNVSRISENTSLKLSGTVGTDSNTASTVKVNTKYGGVRLDY